MNWVSSFYRRQADLCSDCYYYPVGPHNRDKVALIERLGLKGKIVLDVGAGSGQNAIAMSDFSKEVLALELIDDFVCFGKELLLKGKKDNCNIIQGDFYHFSPESLFDVVTYWDGFGIGEDCHQQKLLSNIYRWLKPDGGAFIEVYTPWYGDYSIGKEMRFGKSLRRYGFDHEKCRWLDSWWEEGKENESVSQSLRCYSPADFCLLLHGTGLELEAIYPCLNYKNFDDLYSGELSSSVTYIAQLKKVKS